MKKNITGRDYIINSVIFLLFACLTFAGAASHEMWFDEAESWVIARDNSIMDLWAVLRSEGHPFLWYFVLKIFISAGCSADILPFISWGFTVITVALILLKAPFNKLLKYAVIFSSGFLFFNSVISRIYCIIPFVLALIAICFPYREKHPVFYGFLIALLTNTHICICGIVAVLGINMIIELIMSWKTDDLKNRAGKLCGLSIAAAGVLLVLFTLAGSLETNAEITSNSKSISDMINDIVLSFYDIPVQSALPFSIDGIAEIISVAYMLFLVFAFMFMRHYRISFWIMLSFMVFYSIICGAIWYTIPNRATLVFFVFAFAYWIASATEPRNYMEFHFKVDTKIIKYILKKLSEYDKNAFKNFSRILTFSFLITLPCGLIMLISDYMRDFSPEKSAAEYIKNNYSAEDTVIVTATDAYPQLSCYLTEYTLYSVYLNKEYTYHDHNVSYVDMAKNVDKTEVKKYLNNWNSILFLDTNSVDNESDLYNIPGNLVFKNMRGMEYINKATSVFVCEVNEDDILNHFND